MMRPRPRTMILFLPPVPVLQRQVRQGQYLVCSQVRRTIAYRKNQALRNTLKTPHARLRYPSSASLQTTPRTSMRVSTSNIQVPGSLHRPNELRRPSVDGVLTRCVVEQSMIELIDMRAQTNI